MLFNKKLMMGLINGVGVLLILVILLSITMYVWAYFGTPPLPMFSVDQGLISYFKLINQLATFTFFYIMLGAFAALVKGSKLQDGFKK